MAMFWCLQKLRSHVLLAAFSLLAASSACAVATGDPGSLTRIASAVELQLALADESIRHIVVTEHLDLRSGARDASGVTIPMPFNVRGAAKSIRVCPLPFEPYPFRFVLSQPCNIVQDLKP
jgi:hypothetical protein